MTEFTFDSILPLYSHYLAPGEYAIRDKDNRTLFQVEGAAFADWIVAQINLPTARTDRMLELLENLNRNLPSADQA